MLYRPSSVTGTVLCRKALDESTLFDDLELRLRTVAAAEARDFFRGTDEERNHYHTELATFIGYSHAEIDTAQREFGHVFPRAFRVYLHRFGKCCGMLFRGTRMIPIDEFVSVRQDARHLLDDIGQRDLIPSDSLVFLEHQGYDFAFIIPTETSTDPAVYWCSEGGDKKQAASSFTEFLMNDVENSERMYRELKEYGGYSISDCKELQPRQRQWWRFW